MYTKEELYKYLIEDGLSYAEVGKKYNLSGAAIKKAAKKFQLPISPKRKINPKETFNAGKRKYPERFCLNCGKKLQKYEAKFCSHNCNTEYNEKQYIEAWKQGMKTGYKGDYQISPIIRRYLFTKYNNKCCKCGWSEINPKTKQVPLQIHHVDGNVSNNKEENLQLLCPNCHSLTETFGNLNKGNGKRANVRMTKEKLIALSYKG